ncbi:MAG: TerB family tellurite resistance protein [Sulfuritalea sp.]|nr:TerB family tellurite resistance protein [Sulfuritalea sp.]
MINGIKRFFAQVIEPDAKASGGASDRALHVATAALLMEMMRMDATVTADEINSVANALQTQFALEENQVAELMALAKEEAQQATDYFQFTSLINQSFDGEQKAWVVEYMWQVAYADGHLDAHEQHFMRKIADLLYVPHSEYIAAKQRARDRIKTDE